MQVDDINVFTVSTESLRPVAVSTRSQNRDAPNCVDDSKTAAVSLSASPALPRCETYRDSRRFISSVALASAEFARSRSAAGEAAMKALSSSTRLEASAWPRASVAPTDFIATAFRWRARISSLYLHAKIRIGRNMSSGKCCSSVSPSPTGAFAKMDAKVSSASLR
jgi:hypothetical protein